MTTEHIPGIDENLTSLIEAATVLEQSITDRARQLREEQDKAAADHAKAIKVMAIAAATNRRKHLDRNLVINEELGQLSEILGSVNEQPGSTPEERIDPLTGERIRVIAREELSTPEPASAAEPEPQVPPATIVVPQHNTAEHPVQVDINTTVIQRVNPRDWSGLQWLLAIIGVIIALFVASATDQKVVEDLDGFGRGLVSVIYWVGCIGLGFFGGGFIGLFFDRNEK